MVVHSATYNAFYSFCFDFKFVLVYTFNLCYIVNPCICHFNNLFYPVLYSLGSLFCLYCCNLITVFGTTHTAWRFGVYNYLVYTLCHVHCADCKQKNKLVNCKQDLNDCCRILFYFRLQLQNV